VFEKFVGRLYRDIDPSARLQVQKNFGSLQLKPDIVTDTMIVDTKYKLVSDKEQLTTQDKYQMFAYGINFKQPHVMLLYPKHHVNVTDDLVLGEEENGVYLKMRSLDLGGEFVDGYDAYVDIMRKRVKELKDE
jgi:5-methylcytosine-specific restriction enzyme subunit McrC